MSIKRRKANNGYTKPDYIVRCKFCSMGVDETGQNIGGLIASQHITCQVESGRSAHIATIQRCINNEHWRPDGSKTTACNRIAGIKIEPNGRRLNLSKEHILNCCRQSQGNHFTLNELQSGKITIIDIPKKLQTFTHPDYDPNKFTEAVIEDVQF